MAGKFRAVVPEHGMEQEVSRLVTGVVAARLLSTEQAADVLVEEFASALKLRPKDAQYFRRAFRRWMDSVHVTGDGYEQTLGKVLGVLLDGVEDHEVCGLLMLVVSYESHGFRYPQAEEFRLSIGVMFDTFETSQEESPLFMDEALRGFMVAGSTESDFFFQFASKFTHMLATFAGWDCQKKNAGRSVPLAPWWIPDYIFHRVCRAHEGILRLRTHNELAGVKTKVYLDIVKVGSDIWNLTMRLISLGFERDDISDVVSRFRLGNDAALCASIKRWDLTADIIREVIANDALVDLGEEEFPDLLDAWRESGSTVKVTEFYKLGGTRQSWEAHVVREREERERREEADRVDREEQARAKAELAEKNAPKGRNRGQKHAPRYEPAVVDFDAMCGELDVATHFPALNQDTTRVILIHGLLREGERLASMARLPERDEKKLWKQCREHLATGVSRRVFKSALRALTTNHLASVSRGKYKLAGKKDRWPAAQAVLTQLQGAASKHSS